MRGSSPTAYNAWYRGWIPTQEVIQSRFLARVAPGSAARLTECPVQMCEGTSFPAALMALGRFVASSSTKPSTKKKISDRIALR